MKTEHIDKKICKQNDLVKDRWLELSPGLYFTDDECSHCDCIVHTVLGLQFIKVPIELLKQALNGLEFKIYSLDNNSQEQDQLKVMVSLDRPVTTCEIKRIINNAGKMFSIVLSQEPSYQLVGLVRASDYPSHSEEIIAQGNGKRFNPTDFLEEEEELSAIEALRRGHFHKVTK